MLFELYVCIHSMNCIKCGCSFCWLCMEIIEDTELPNHYKDPNSGCKGKQFEGMDVEPPPRWLVCCLTILAIICCIPASALAIVFGLICFPCVLICGCKNEDGSQQSICQTISGCWFLWLIILTAIIIIIPAIIIWCIWEIIKAIYNLFRICCPCLPEIRPCCGLTDNDGDFQRIANDENDVNDDHVELDVNELIGNDIDIDPVTQHSAKEDEQPLNNAEPIPNENENENENKDKIQ